MQIASPAVQKLLDRIMNENIGIIDQFDIIFDDYIDLINDDRVKLAAIWYDTLLFDDFWNHENCNYCQHLGRIVDTKPSFVDTITELLQLAGANGDTADHFAKKWRGIYDSQQHEFYNFDNGIEFSEATNEFLHQWESELVEKDVKNGWHYIDASKEAHGSVHYLKKSIELSLKLPIESTLVMKGYYYNVMRKMLDFVKPKQIDFAQAAIEARVPGFGSLSWNEIADVCHTPQHEAFRRKISAMYEARQTREYTEVKRICESAIEDDIECMIRKRRPNTMLSNIFQGIVGNATPVGWALSAKQTLKDKKDKDQSDWIYFMTDLHDMTNIE